MYIETRDLGQFHHASIGNASYSGFGFEVKYPTLSLRDSAPSPERRHACLPVSLTCKLMNCASITSQLDVLAIEAIKALWLVIVPSGKQGRTSSSPVQLAGKAQLVPYRACGLS